VLWYNGTDDTSPTVAVLSHSTVIKGTSATIYAKQLDKNGKASPLPGATVYVGSRVATSNAQGKVVMPMPRVGDFGVRVEKDGLIRSATTMLHVRCRTSVSNLWASKTSIYYRHYRHRTAKITLAGRLGVSGGRRVNLYYRTVGMRGYAYKTHAYVRSSGIFVFNNVKVPRKTTYFKVVFPGDSEGAPSASRSKRIKVRW
jgi:hypothetical protein